MRSKEYRVKVAPIAWQRVVRKADRSYDSQAKDKVCFGLYTSQQHNEEPFFDKPIHIDVTFYLAIPKPLKVKPAPLSYHTQAPYMEQLCRFFFDALKGIVIANERVICSFSAKKLYDKEPRTEFKITEV